MEMGFYNDAVKRETTSNRVKWVMGLLDCDYQSAYRAVKAVRNGENMDCYINNHYTQSFRKQLKGIRSWWNRNAKSKYKTPLKKEDVYVFNGKLMNDKYQLTGDNRYFDNLTFICIKLEDIENVGKFAIPRFQIGGRWFNDVVDNNTRRELEND